MTAKDYKVQLQKLTGEADKILGEFKGNLGADYKQTKSNLAEITKEIKNITDVVSDIQAKGFTSAFGVTQGSVSPEVKSMIDAIVNNGPRPKASEFKAARIADPGSGGFLAVPQFISKVAQKLYDGDSIMQNAEIIQVESDIGLLPYEVGDSSASWVGEGESRDVDSAGTIGLAQIPLNTLIAKIKVTDELINGAAIGIEQYLTNQVSDKLSRSLGAAFTIGDGLRKPKGVFTEATIPSVPTTGAGTAKAVAVDDLLDVYGKLPSAADANAGWYMSKATFAAISKIKGTDQLYLLPSGLAPGMPATLLGFPVRLCGSAPDTKTAGNVPIIFGDMRSAYKVLQGRQMTYQRDDITGADAGMIYLRFKAYMGGQTVMPSSLVRTVIGS